MEPERRTPANPSESHADRVVLRVEADSTDEELEAMADALATWIEERDPDFFAPEDD